MSALSPLHEALLGLGLEDWIPLPEAASEPEVLAATGSDESLAQISQALVELLRFDLIEVWRGPWNVDPVPVPAGQAVPLLLDRRRYSFDEEGEHGLERVYYVNVENFRSGT